MNKQKIRKEFEENGIKVESFEFNENGHRLQIKLKEEMMLGFEQLDSIYIDGFNIVSPKYVEGNTMRITLVPCNEREFTYYIQKYVNSYGLSRSTALTELERIVRDQGDPDVLSKLYKYKKKY